MSTANTRFAVVASTGGSVVREALKVSTFASSISLIVVDRECGATALAEEFGIPLVRIEEKDSQVFSEKLCALLRKENIDFVFSFYLRLYKGSILKEYANRIVNFHPSLLPSFKGFHAFEKAMAARVPFLGSTAHFVDDSIDGGPIVTQSIAATHSKGGEALLRHKVFVQQVKQLIQIAAWLREDRISVAAGLVRIREAHFAESEFSPNLEDPEALGIDIPSPF